MIRKMMAAAVVACCASAAQATVIYDWTTFNIGNVPAFTSRIEIDDAAWLSGSVRYTWGITQECNRAPNVAACRADPTAPVTRFLFDVIGPDATIDLRPRLGMSIDRDLQRVLVANLQFLPNGLLSGSIEGHNDATDIGMSGSGTWGIRDYGSDFPNMRVCPGSLTYPEGCTTTGAFVLNPVTIPVSEPGMLPLLALGAFGVAASMQRRRRPK